MLAFLLATACAAAGPEVVVERLDGKTVAGSLLELSVDRVVVQTADGPVAVPTSDLLALEPRTVQVPVSVQPAAMVRLIDGSILAATGFSVSTGKASAILAGGELELQTTEIASVRFKDDTEQIAAQWAEMMKSQPTADLLVIRKGESIDYLEGVLGDITADHVQLELDGAVTPVKRARVQGLVYYHKAGRERPEAVCAVVDAAGSKLNVRTLALEEGELRIVTPAGVELVRELDQIARIDFSRGKVQFLSDLKPAAVTLTPFFDVIPEPAMDRNLDGGPLRINGVTYRKGLALHSRTLLSYRLDGKFRRLQAMVGIDDAIAGAGHVQLVISGDGKPLFDDAVRGTDKPRPIDLDISGVKRLEILVDFGEHLDVGDHLDLCDARVIK